MKILSIPILLASSFALAQENQKSDSVAELETLTIESSPIGNKDHRCHPSLECSVW